MPEEEVVSLRANSPPMVSHKNRHPQMEVVEVAAAVVDNSTIAVDNDGSIIMIGSSVIGLFASLSPL